MRRHKLHNFIKVIKGRHVIHHSLCPAVGLMNCHNIFYAERLRLLQNLYGIINKQCSLRVKIQMFMQHLPKGLALFRLPELVCRHDIIELISDRSQR